MAASYQKRFDGQTPEIIKCAYRIGREQTRQIYAPDGDLVAFGKYLEKVSDDPDIGKHPKVDASTPENLADYIVENLLNRLRKAEKRAELLQAELTAQRLNTQARTQGLKLKSLELLAEVT